MSRVRLLTGVRGAFLTMVVGALIVSIAPMGAFADNVPKGASIDDVGAEIPPTQWGEVGRRACMLETEARWPHYKPGLERPAPVAAYSTHGPLVPAFPGAEGFGAYAFGGRGGKVLRVTNLKDKGPGSFRAAVESEGPRIVIFDVSGIIRLETPIHVANPYLTIAGQTAPGDGVTVAGQMFHVYTFDVIIRHIRFRLGNYRGEVAEPHWHDWAFFLNSANHVILDHVAISWGVSGNLVVQRNDNVTIQNCILAKPLTNSYHAKGTRGYGALVRGRHGARYSFLRNLWANHRARVPRPGNYLSHQDDPDGLLMDFRNNVIYQGIGANYDTDSITRYNFVNNYCLTPWRLIERSPFTRGYLAGNVEAGRETADQWKLLLPGNDVRREYHEQDSPFESGDVTTVTAEAAWEQVMATAGPWLRDAHDANVVREARNYHAVTVQGATEAPYPLPDWWTEGGIDCQEEVGGLPECVSVMMPEAIDANRSGIPDWWEAANGLDSKDSDIANKDSNGNGYTNIEDYINDLEAIRITHDLIQ